MAVITGPFKQIVTMAEMPMKGPLNSGHLTIHKDACICTDSGQIMGIGAQHDLEKTLPGSSHEEIKGPAVLLPGFIDTHTHICWAGSRANDFAMRLEGKTYLEIAESGGGIWSSVLQCRQADKLDLVDGIIERVTHQLKGGVTTIEVKSGYGLEVEAELKVMEAINEANRRIPAELISTCLAAHMKPKDFDGSPEEYLNHLVSDLLPVLKERQLTNRIDIFIEQSAFSQDEAIKYLCAARDMGFSMTVHGDQFSCGGSAVAVSVGAVSVDHLEASTEIEIGLLSRSNVIATVLPGASIGLGMAFAPARKLLDAGCSVVIASDWNPGSAPMGELLTQASILGVYENLSIAEVLAGLTYRAAAALELNDRGSLAPGMKADMQAYAVADYREIIYNQGRVRPDWVWVDGELVIGDQKQELRIKN